MKILWIIAKNTFREIIRDRILYGLIVFAILLFGISLALGQLSFAEQARISLDFGFTAIHLGAVAISIFLGASLVAKEIDKKTVLTLLARPISRLQFLFGKCLGLLMLILVLINGLALILVFVTIGLNLSPDIRFVIGLHGIFLESVVLLGVTLFFSTFARPVMVVIFSTSFFLICHWLESLSFFASRSDNQVFRAFAFGIVGLLPDLEQFNWRSLFLYGDTINYQVYAVATLFALLWFFFTLTASALIIRRKDFA